MVVEARELAASRWIMHKIGDESEEEYRGQLNITVDGDSADEGAATKFDEMEEMAARYLERQERLAREAAGLT